MVARAHIRPDDMLDDQPRRQLAEAKQDGPGQGHAQWLVQRGNVVTVFTSVGAGVAFISKELPGSEEHATHGECGRDERPQAQA